MSGPQKALKQRRPKNARLRDTPSTPLIGYMRVSKVDGSQVLDRVSLRAYKRLGKATR
jgi:hypothetical protein